MSFTLETRHRDLLSIIVNHELFVVLSLVRKDRK